MINAEPPPEQPPYPHALKSELQRCYGSKTDTKTLWRAGGWMHQKRVAAAATLAQERGRPFSSTGFEVAPRVIAPERSVLPGEQLATAAVVEKLDSGVLAAVAVERSAANPQLFNDDNDVTKRNVRGTVVDAAAALRRSEAHDAKVRSKYPQVTRGAHRHSITSTHVSPAHIVRPRTPAARPTNSDNLPLHSSSSAGARAHRRRDGVRSRLAAVVDAHPFRRRLARADARYAGDRDARRAAEAPARRRAGGRRRVLDWMYGARAARAVWSEWIFS